MSFKSVNMTDWQPIAQKLEQGIRSLSAFSLNPESLAYWQSQGLPGEDFAMAVLDPEQIDFRLHGVCFS